MINSNMTFITAVEKGTVQLRTANSMPFSVHGTYLLHLPTGYHYNKNMLTFYLHEERMTDSTSLFEHASGVYNNVGFLFRQWKLTSDVRLFAVKYGIPDKAAAQFVTQFQDHARVCRKYWDEPAFDETFRLRLETDNKQDYVVFAAAQAVWRSKWDQLERQFAEELASKEYVCSSTKASFCGAVGKRTCRLSESVTPTTAVAEHHQG